MRRSKQILAAAPAREASAPPGLLARRWHVSTRLTVILLVPVLTNLVLGGMQVRSSVETWQSAKVAEHVARIVAAGSAYHSALLDERDLSVAPLLQGRRDSTVVRDVRAVTDLRAADFRREVAALPAGHGLEQRISQVERVWPQLAAVRAQAFTTGTDPVATEEGYAVLGRLIIGLANELGFGMENSASYGRMVYSLALAKEAASLQRSVGLHLMVRPGDTGPLREQQLNAFLAYRRLEVIAARTYGATGTDATVARLTSGTAQRQATGPAGPTGPTGHRRERESERLEGPGRLVPGGEHRTTVAGSGRAALPGLERMTERIAAGEGPAVLAAQGITPATWMAASTRKFEAYGRVERQLIDAAVDEAARIASDARRAAFVKGLVVVVALLAAFLVTALMARQMSRSMRGLRTAALTIAEQRLPVLYDRLSRTDPGRVDTQVAPIPITTSDEIGEVARAFDQVHREAVRLAAEQALLRGNINAIFTNLSRRNQSLIEGQLTLITDLENNEADPDQLENLFKLDHLATRMRRNGENLLVLAGEEPGRRWDQPVPLIDVLRAASSEVEQYERIELSGVPEAEIHGRAVTDLVHLLAELLENATTFSSPQTKVRVTATRLPDGRVMIEIHDKGIGLTAEDFADINHKLANPPTVDAAISQRMGLFVVGRLSDRHGIRVQLRPSGEQAGTTSLVMLPDVITHGGGGEQQPPVDQFTVSQIIPEQHAFQQQQSAPMRTAAELGFDDSRYEIPNDIRELDPVGRSLMREERRAALEAQTHGNPAIEPPRYGDDFQAPDPSYDNGATAYVDQQRAYDQQTAYEEPQQPSYDEAYFGQGGAVQNGNGQQRGGNDTFSATGGYPEPAYAEPAQEEQAPAAPETYSGFEESSYQDDWPQQQDYQSSYRSEYAPEPESSQAADVKEPDRVGFDRPGSTPSAGHALTDAGLPRRGSTASMGGTSAGAVNGRQDVSQDQPTTGGPNGDWRSANDERWQQASQLKKPKAGGVTSSGLPRRVPKANLVEGAATTTPQGGPQISRAPEDVRGRLSNLRRGVQRGRNAGSETNGQGFGPDSTYNQER
jgi:signal transduction histidine kinase